jgi:hypothetical protein
MELSASAISVAVTYDGWSSRAHDGYVGITVHWITPQITMRTACLAVENLTGSHTHDRIADLLREHFKILPVPLEAQVLGTHFLFLACGLIADETR